MGNKNFYYCVTLVEILTVAIVVAVEAATTNMSVEKLVDISKGVFIAVDTVALLSVLDSRVWTPTYEPYTQKGHVTSAWTTVLTALNVIVALSNNNLTVSIIGAVAAITLTSMVVKITD